MSACTPAYPPPCQLRSSNLHGSPPKADRNGALRSSIVDAAGWAGEALNSRAYGNDVPLFVFAVPCGRRAKNEPAPAIGVKIGPALTSCVHRLLRWTHRPAGRDERRRDSVRRQAPQSRAGDLLCIWEEVSCLLPICSHL